MSTALFLARQAFAKSFLSRYFGIADHVSGQVLDITTAVLRAMAAPRYSWKSYSPSPAHHYVRNPTLADHYIHTLFTHGPCGLDIEWKPNFRKGEQENPVALVQLATLDTVLLIQVSAMSGSYTALHTVICCSSPP